MIGVEYTAGFMDGEGTVGISISRSTAGYPIPTLRVAFANIDPTPMEQIQKRWGGSLGKQKTGVYALHFNGKQAYALLQDVQPYLIVKKENASAAIAFYATPFVSPDQNAQGYMHKLELALQVMAVTRAGYHAVRSNKMMVQLQEAIEHVRIYLAAHSPGVPQDGGAA